MPDTDKTFREVSCPLCPDSRGEPAMRVRDRSVSEERFQVVRCASCGLLFLSPRPPDGALSGYYPKEYGPYDFSPPSDFLPRRPDGIAPWRTRLKEVLLRRCYGYPVQPEPAPLWALLRPLILAASHLVAFFPRFVPEGRLLEVGCSTGQQLRRCRELGWSVMGVEPGEEASRFARDTMGLDVTTGDLLGTDLPEGSFDAAVVSYVIEHVPRPLDCLRELRRVLKPGGDLYISTNNVAALEARLFGRYWCAWEPPRHLTYFTVDSLTRMLEKAGFAVQETRFELFSNGLDFALGLRSLALELFGPSGAKLFPPAVTGLIRALYAPLGAPLAALGFGTRFRLRARPAGNYILSR